MQWLGVIVLGLMAGTGIGYLRAVQHDGRYQSIGSLRLAGSAALGLGHSATGVNLETGAAGADLPSPSEARLLLYRRAGELRSEAVLLSAVQRGHVNRLPPFRGMSVEQIVNHLRQSPELDTEVQSVSGDAVILVITYTTADPRSAQVVVQSLMDAFRERCDGTDRRQAAIDSAASELPEVEQVLQRIEALERQYLQQMRQHESQVSGAEPQESHRRQVNRLQREQQALSREIDQLSSRLDAARAAVSQGQSAESVMRTLRPTLTDTPGIASGGEGVEEQRENASKESLRKAVAALRRQLAGLKEQRVMVETEIMRHLDALRQKLVDDAALDRLQQEIETQHQAYEQATATLRLKGKTASSQGSAAAGIGCTEMRRATLGAAQQEGVLWGATAGGGIGTSVGLLIAMITRLVRRR